MEHGLLHQSVGDLDNDGFDDYVTGNFSNGNIDINGGVPTEADIAAETASPVRPYPPQGCRPRSGKSIAKDSALFTTIILIEIDRPHSPYHLGHV